LTNLPFLYTLYELKLLSLTQTTVPRGKNTNVFLICQECKMQNYNVRINKKTRKNLEINKYCPKCDKLTPHKSGSEIRHSST